MQQRSLFDLDLSRGAANPQSAAAHARLAPAKPRLRDLVLAVIVEAGDRGATLYECCERLGKAPHSLSGRLAELRAAGRIVDTGRTRANAGGNACAVYVGGE